MRLVTFTINRTPRPGVLVGDTIHDLSGSGLPVGPDGDLLAIVSAGPDCVAQAERMVAGGELPTIALSRVKLLPPLLRPPKIVGIGLNYMDHCIEAGFKVPAFPVVFGKFPSSTVGPHDEIRWSEDICREVDYEVELGVVIGRDCSFVEPDDALDYVFGYTVINDVSARDLQFSDPSGQYDRGKSIDTFCPWGPVIRTATAIRDPQALRMSCTLNGRVVQDSSTSNMIFSVAQLISFISKGIRLQPGDLIATGTPAGVGFIRKPPLYLADGDECICEIEGIGRLVNRVRVASRASQEAERVPA